jgi:hypothetical protein
MLLPKGKELLNVLILNLPANFYSGRVQQSLDWLTNSQPFLQVQERNQCS